MNYFNESGTFETEMKKSYDKTGFGTPATETQNKASSCDKTMMANPNMTACGAMPIYECPQERVCHRYICHEVPHVMPCNTRIINHHVYRHTFNPVYTCCEENVCENVFDQRCC